MKTRMTRDELTTLALAAAALVVTAAATTTMALAFARAALFI